MQVPTGLPTQLLQQHSASILQGWPDDVQMGTMQPLVVLHVAFPVPSHT
jgi:hypothetical protein